MKRMWVIAAALAAAVLSACGNAEEAAKNAATESVSEFTSAQETEETASGQETTETPLPVETVNISAEEKAEIQSLLIEAGKFSYGYLHCEEIADHIDENQYITMPKTDVYGNDYDFKWCLVTDGEITSMDGLKEKALSIFTEKAYLGFDFISTDYKEKNGKLYLRSDAGGDGSLLGTDYAYILSAEEPDGETIVLNMRAFGAGENWDLPYDLEEDFSIKLKRTENGLRIDTFDPHVEQYITWAYTHEKDLI